MKPNPEQDADRAAFESAAKVHMWEYGSFLRDCNDIDATRTYELPHVEDAWNMWQAAKADSRAMQDAFEQVCEAASALADDFSEYYDDSEDQNGERLHTVHKMRKILSLAAPFRKTGV